jgi:hypothetical protein
MWCELTHQRRERSRTRGERRDAKKVFFDADAAKMTIGVSSSTISEVFAGSDR